jgi:antitoxin VapB
MNARIPAQNLPHQTLTTVFTSGNSQAVRLPKEFRFNTKQVTIERRGDEIVLRANPQSLGKRLADLMGDLPPMTEMESAEWDAAMAAVRDNQPPQERDFSWMDASVSAKKKTSRKKI